MYSNVEARCFTLVYSVVILPCSAYALYSNERLLSMEIYQSFLIVSITSDVIIADKVIMSQQNAFCFQIAFTVIVKPFIMTTTVKLYQIASTD